MVDDRSVTWLDDAHVSVDGEVFRLMGTGDSSGEAGRLLLYKPRQLVEEYLRRIDELQDARVFEVGILHGGSTAFLAALLHPERLVAVDIRPERNAWLDTWLRERGLVDRVRIHHGVDQADRATLERLVDDELGGAVDLVIDDASHRLQPSVVTFDALFPRLRAGGLYIIEDWAASLFLSRAVRLTFDPHRLEELRADEEAMREKADRELWRLVLRLTLAMGAHPELATELSVTPGLVVVRRGPLELDPASFSVDDWVTEPVV